MKGKTSIAEAGLTVNASAPAAISSVVVYRPKGSPISIQGQDISFQVVANGTLLVVLPTGKPAYAFSPGQWVTVNTPPV